MKWNEKPKETELHKTYISKFIQFAYKAYMYIHANQGHIYVTGNKCNQGFHVIPETFRDYV